MMIARLEPDIANAAVRDGYVLPRHTQLRARPVEGGQTPCIYRNRRRPRAVAGDDRRSRVHRRPRRAGGGRRLAPHRGPRPGCGFRLKRSDGGRIGALPLDRLTLFVNGQVRQPPARCTS